MQKMYYMTCYLLLPMEGIGKSLRVWVRLGRANRPDNSLILHIYIIIRKNYYTYFYLINAFYS